MDETERISRTNENKKKEMKIFRFNDYIKEDSATGGAPAAGIAPSSGMGAIVSAQPSSIPGATTGADFALGGGTVGSGDVSFGYNPGGGHMMTQTVPIDGFNNSLMKKKRGKLVKTKPLKIVQPNKEDYTKDNKVMSYTDFIKLDFNKPKIVKQ